MDKDKEKSVKKKFPGKKTDAEMEGNGIVVEINEMGDAVAPSSKDLETQLKAGGVEVVEGKKSPDDVWTLT